MCIWRTSNSTMILRALCIACQTGKQLSNVALWIPCVLDGYLGCHKILIVNSMRVAVNTCCSSCRINFQLMSMSAASGSGSKRSNGSCTSLIDSSTGVGSLVFDPAADMQEVFNMHSAVPCAQHMDAPDHHVAWHVLMSAAMSAHRRFGEPRLCNLGNDQQFGQLFEVGIYSNCSDHGSLLCCHQSHSIITAK